MKKLLCSFVFSVVFISRAFGLTSFATDVNYNSYVQDLASDIIILEVDGKLYYLDNLDELLSEETKNTCIYSAVNGKIRILYDKLLQACQQSLARMGTASDNVGKKNAVTTLLSWAQYKKTALAICLLNKENLNQKYADDVKITETVKINADLDECIQKIGIHSDKDSCPLYFSVPSEKYKDNMKNLNSIYFGKQYEFSNDKNLSYVGNGTLVGVFNGYMLAVCDGAEPVWLAIPSFSGAAHCQGGNYETIPNFGSLPSGVYLARKSNIQDMSKYVDYFSWGKYRIPLESAVSNQSFDRGSFYLHGNTDTNKHSSGGCISLGTNIAEFIDNFFNFQNQDLIVIVDTVPNVEQEWNK